MRKKSLLVVVSLLFALSIAVIPAQAAAPSIMLNGQTVQCDTPPMVENGSTLVPMRPVFDALGAQVNWDDPTKTVTAATYDTTVEMVIGGDVKVNGQKLNTTAQAMIYNSTTMVPLPLLSESLGANVDWNPDTQTVTITTVTETTTPDFPAIETETPDETVVEDQEGTETETTDDTAVDVEESTETETTDDAAVDVEESTETETTDDTAVDVEESTETETTDDTAVDVEEGTE